MPDKFLKNPENKPVAKYGGSPSPFSNSTSSSSPYYGQQPLKPEDALLRYKDELTPFEKSEVGTYDYIYTVGSVRRSTLKEVSDREGYYLPQVGE